MRENLIPTEILLDVLLLLSKHKVNRPLLTGKNNPKVRLLLFQKLKPGQYEFIEQFGQQRRHPRSLKEICTKLRVVALPSLFSLTEALLTDLVQLANTSDYEPRIRQIAAPHLVLTLGKSTKEGLYPVRYPEQETEADDQVTLEWVCKHFYLLLPTSEVDPVESYYPQRPPLRTR